jgi:hypothetical protein
MDMSMDKIIGLIGHEDPSQNSDLHFHFIFLGGAAKFGGWF